MLQNFLYKNQSPCPRMSYGYSGQAKTNVFTPSRGSVLGLDSSLVLSVGWGRGTSYRSTDERRSDVYR